MSTIIRTQRRYDHRLKQLVLATGNITVALDCGVPRSTAYGWLTRSHSEVVSIDVLDSEVAELQRKVIQLRRRNARLIALLRLIFTVLKIADFSLARLRISDADDKLRLVGAIEQARNHFKLRTVLRIIGLSFGRFHAWAREPCGIEHLQACPKSSPQQLTAHELSSIHDMVTSQSYRHVPTGTLARLAQRALLRRGS
jgi:putative transposase